MKIFLYYGRLGQLKLNMIHLPKIFIK